MADSLIKFVSQPPLVQDALKKQGKEKKPSPPVTNKKRAVKKDSKRIIDTYA